MNSLLIYLFFSFQAGVHQPAESVADFMKRYHAAVDPTNAIDTIRSITMEVQWIVESDNSALNLNQFRINHISSDPTENMNLILQPLGWTVSDVNNQAPVWQKSTVRGFILLVGHSSITNLSIASANDSITVISKADETKIEKRYTFDNRTNLPIAYSGSMTDPIQGKLTTNILYRSYGWFSNLLVNTFIEIIYPNNRMRIKQIVSNVHFNLTRDQVKALAK